MRKLLILPFLLATLFLASWPLWSAAQLRAALVDVRRPAAEHRGPGPPAFSPSDRLRHAILENWPQGRLRELAVEEGMVNLRQAGVARVFEGVTTVEEIVRETFLEQ